MRITAKFTILIIFCLPFEVISEKCEFYETVNITDGITDANKNILHNEILYRPQNYETYNYIIVNNTKVATLEHIRGCICQVKICIRNCCHANQVMSYPDFECTDFGPNELSVNLTTNAKDYEIAVLNDTYKIIYRTPCTPLRSLEPFDDEDDAWMFWKVIISYSILLLFTTTHDFVLLNSSSLNSSPLITMNRSLENNHF